MHGPLMCCGYTATFIPPLGQTSGSSVASDLSFILDQAAWAGFISLPGAPMPRGPHKWTLQTPGHLTPAIAPDVFLTIYAKEPS